MRCEPLGRLERNSRQGFTSKGGTWGGLFHVGEVEEISLLRRQQNVTPMVTG